MTDQSTEPAADQLLDLVRRAGTIGPGTAVERAGIELTHVSPDRVVGTMPVEGNRQPYGVLHGGASCVLAETLASVGSAIQAGAGRLAMGVEINASNHRSARDGLVTGTATALDLGRTMATWQIEITDGEGRRICTARVTCALRDA